MELNVKQKKLKNPALAYLGYLFQTFLKRPFGYIVAILYIVYLSIILVIVPKALHFDPLFIWTIGGFNMPLFNLFFIAGAAASIAVAVFRTGRDDGTELILSAKPLNKGTSILMKTVVYVLIMLLICLITNIIAGLTWPIFGEYNEITNATGITWDNYRSLFLSVLIGNVVNMLLFGGIAVFISMSGGQVIVMIGTIGIVFVICLLNVLFPQLAKSPIELLSDKYDTEILSYSCNTLNQYENPTDNFEPFNYATIQCSTDDSGQEGYHYDTYEYWEKVYSESGRRALNYIDFGKQLSCLYTSFGLNDSKLKQASKLVIGVNSAYEYHINQGTNVTQAENIEKHNYPLCIYGLVQRQGKTYSNVSILGGNMNISSSNWFAISTLLQVDFNSATYVSTSADSPNTSEEVIKHYQKPWNRINELSLNHDQQQQAKVLYQEALSLYDPKYILDDSKSFPIVSEKVIENDNSGILYQGPYADLPAQDKYNLVSKVHYYWALLAHQTQLQAIQEYWAQKGFNEVMFPFNTKAILTWFNDLDWWKTSEYTSKQELFNHEIFNNGIYIEHIDDKGQNAYDRLKASSFGYAETYSNLYTYSVSNFFNISKIIAIWSIISGCLFASSIIVYRKTDFK